jgi:tetratricopeptide (TPR) repeat protein
MRRYARRSLEHCKDGTFVDNVTKRQLKKPDQFIGMTERGISWASENQQKAIVGGAIAVVVILIAVAGYSFYSSRSAAATTAFGTAMQTYQTPVANAEQPAPPGMKTFADSKTRALAANKQFVQVAHQYGLTKPGKLALYFAGLTYMEAGENGPAEQALEKTASSWDQPLAALGKMALAQLDQQTGRDSQAVNLYTELSKENASTVPSGLAQLQMAEMYQAEGQTQKARDIYARLKDKDKDAKGQPGPAGDIAAQKLNPQPAGGAPGGAGAPGAQ